MRVRIFAYPNQIISIRTLLAYYKRIPLDEKENGANDDLESIKDDNEDNADDVVDFNEPAFEDDGDDIKLIR